MNDQQRIAQLETALSELIATINSPEVLVEKNFRPLSQQADRALRTLKSLPADASFMPPISIIDTPAPARPYHPERITN